VQGMKWLEQEKGEREFLSGTKHKKPRRRPRSGWEDNVNVDLRDMYIAGYCGLDSRGSG
jgi:hypothetical protein